MSETPTIVRWMVVAGALAGALGVVMAAAAAHSDATFAAASAMLLAHAPVLLILGLGGATRLRHGAPCALLMVAGLLLFAGDSGLRGVTGHGAFAFAAPIGGTLLIVSWLAIALAAVFARR